VLNKISHRLEVIQVFLKMKELGIPIQDGIVQRVLYAADKMKPEDIKTVVLNIKEDIMQGRYMATMQSMEVLLTSLIAVNEKLSAVEITKYHMETYPGMI
jgi:hydroxypyruvate isomerase